MAETTEYMEQLGVTPALFKKWQAEDAVADEPAPFQTQHDALILAQRRQSATEEAGSLIVEQEPAVGKRQILRGVRVFPRTEEYVLVGHRPAGHDIMAIAAAFREGAVEVTETSEVLVSKDAHVVEEVVVGKAVTDRVETVSDAVRRTDGEVEQTVERARAGRH